MELRRSNPSNRTGSGTTYRIRHLGPALSDFLELREKIPILVRTPYGIATTSSSVVKKHLDRRKLSSESGAIVYSPPDEPPLDAVISRWYGLRSPAGVERIGTTVEFVLEGELRMVLVPMAIKRAGKKTWKPLRSTDPEPLGLNPSCFCRLWRRRIQRLKETTPLVVALMRKHVQKLLKRHPVGCSRGWGSRDVEDLTKVLSLCGCSLGQRVGNSSAFAGSEFRFGRFPPYQCAVELRRRLRDFETCKYMNSSLPRAVVVTFRDQPHVLSRNFDHFAIETLLQLLN